jgi:hypothetical protein
LQSEARRPVEALRAVPAVGLLTVADGGAGAGKRVQLWTGDGALLWDQATLEAAGPAGGATAAAVLGSDSAADAVAVLAQNSLSVFAAKTGEAILLKAE